MNGSVLNSLSCYPVPIYQDQINITVMDDP